MLAKLAISLRAMQLYYHTAHNLVKGGLFNGDHNRFSDFYDELEGDYDAVVERAINKEGEQSADLKMQLAGIQDWLKDSPCCGIEHNKVFYAEGLKLEKKLCQLIEAIRASGPTLGCETLLGDVASRSEVRQYLISQRIK